MFLFFVNRYIEPKSSLDIYLFELHTKHNDSANSSANSKTEFDEVIYKTHGIIKY